MKDPLKRPDGWSDPRDQWEKYDFNKVQRYVEADGLEHWWDVGANVIRTNDAGTYLSFHSFYARGYVGHSYAKLHFEGDFVTVTQEGKSPNSVVFAPNFREKTDAGEQIWHVDHVFRDLVLPDNETYPWVSHWSLLPKISISGMSHFKSRVQQDRFVYLVTTLLSRHKGAPGKALAGEKAKGKVIFGDELMRSFENEELIR